MKILSIAAKKGGVGKTAIATNLAVLALAEGYSVALVDIDPQASACVWGDVRTEEVPPVVSVAPARLVKVLETARNNDVDLAIIDTAPHADAGVVAAAKAADFTLVPCRPSLADLESIKSTVEVLQIVKAAAGIVLNAAPTRQLAFEAKSALADLGLPLAPVVLWQRVAFVHAFTAGQAVTEYEPSGKAAAEIQRLYRWVIGQLGGLTNGNT